MKYDFTPIMDRRGQDAVAADGLADAYAPGAAPMRPDEGFGFIPMWVADMNFPVLPATQQAIIERAMELCRKHGCVVVSDEIRSDIILPGHGNCINNGRCADAPANRTVQHMPARQAIPPIATPSARYVLFDAVASQQLAPMID